MIGDPGELFGRQVVLPGAQIEVAEGVDGVPVLGLIGDQADVLIDRSIELALAEQIGRLL